MSVFYELQNNLIRIFGDSASSSVTNIDDFLNQNYDFILSLDWSGEDESDQLVAFVSKYTEYLLDININLDPIQDWENESKDIPFQRGEYICKKIEVMGQILSEYKIELCILNNNSDQYHIFLVTESDYKSFLKMKEKDEWTIESYRDLVNSDFSGISENENTLWGDSLQSHQNSIGKKSNESRFRSWCFRLSISEKISFIIVFIMTILLIILKI